ncbi:MAG: fatty acid desaturase [Rhizobiales bacterium]|nr:fatty acid desaturase [Hyphomicrobiales bacterium]
MGDAKGINGLAPRHGGSTGSGAAREWRTFAMLAVCHAAWLAGIAAFGGMGGPPAWFGLMLAIFATTLHSSLQHEALHGHPTRNPHLNEALVFLPIGLAYPYRRFRLLHLRHHRNTRLTDPYDDPESWFVAEGDWSRLSPAMRLLLRFNATLLGRLLVGPAVGVIGFLVNDMRLIAAGDRHVIDAWLRHLAGLVVVLAIVVLWAGIHPLVYALAVAYPALSILGIRTFAEHRAEPAVPHRSVIVESRGPFALLFLNNNLHALHHAEPTVAWYDLPALYRQRRDAVLAANGRYVFNGYREIFARFFLRQVNGVVHPFLHRRTDATLASAAGVASNEASHEVEVRSADGARVEIEGRRNMAGVTG